MSTNLPLTRGKQPVLFPPFPAVGRSRVHGPNLFHSCRTVLVPLSNDSLRPVIDN